MTDVENHIEHFGAVFELMCTYNLYGNASNCILNAEDIPFLGCFIGKRSLGAAPVRVKAIVDRPVPRN